MNKVNNFYRLGSLLLIGLLFLQFGCEGDDDSTEEPTAPPMNERLAATFTRQVGSVIAEACTSISEPEGLRRMYSRVVPVPNNSDRLRITMYVTWTGRLTGTRYRVDGVLSINTDGTSPRFVTSSYTPHLGFPRGWHRNMPEALELPR